MTVQVPLRITNTRDTVLRRLMVGSAPSRSWAPWPGFGRQTVGHPAGGARWEQHQEARRSRGRAETHRAARPPVGDSERYESLRMAERLHSAARVLAGTSCWRAGSGADGCDEQLLNRPVQVTGKLVGTTAPAAAASRGRQTNCNAGVGRTPRAPGDKQAPIIVPTEGVASRARSAPRTAATSALMHEHFSWKKR